MGFAGHFGEKVPVPTVKKEMVLMRDASYGVSSHFPSCGSKKPEECEQDELRENMMRHHGVVPLQHVLRWGILPGFGVV